jgi:hypothetical protein
MGCACCNLRKDITPQSAGLLTTSRWSARCFCCRCVRRRLARNGRADRSPSCPLGGLCCISRKLQGHEFSRKIRKGNQLPIRTTSIALPRLPMSLTCDDEAPHIYLPNPRQWPSVQNDFCNTIPLLADEMFCACKVALCKRACRGVVPLQRLNAPTSL